MWVSPRLGHIVLRFVLIMLCFSAHRMTEFTTVSLCLNYVHSKVHDQHPPKHDCYLSMVGYHNLKMNYHVEDHKVIEKSLCKLALMKNDNGS